MHDKTDRTRCVAFAQHVSDLAISHDASFRDPANDFVDALAVWPGQFQLFALWLHRRSEEHTSELQSPDHLVCRLLLEKKNKYPEEMHHGTLHTIYQIQIIHPPRAGMRRVSASLCARPDAVADSVRLMHLLTATLVVCV